ncbi:MAG: mechanosensitive ion channel family protein [Candidatus Promineifilaceae bacterium]|jgi:small-conductance mechanosensitive channel
MEEMLTYIDQFIRSEQVINIFRAILIAIAGFVIARIISRFLARAMKGKLDVHRQMLLQRGSYYIIVAIFLTTALVQLGFDLGILVGTAGILTVALAFASQTSMSNLISGLFLIAENPFQVGDLLQVGTTVGEVLEIDLLSVKLRKFDNTFVRLPNETLIKSEIATLTKYPIRRVDLTLHVAYKEDISRVRDILIDLASKNPLSLEEPEPLFIFRGFGESALEIQFSPWALGENFLALKNSIQEEIKLAFDEAGIEIPFPHRTIYTGSMTDPLPVQVVGSQSHD